jgi:glycosyltransferase involved in cell wall biosynthesis
MRRDPFRRELRISFDAPLVTIVARLGRLSASIAFFVSEPGGDVAGDVVPRRRRRSAPRGAAGVALSGRLGERLTWAGLQVHMPDAYFATDVLVVTSDNEGTNVSAIEAQAAVVPVVFDLRRGMPSVVVDDTGLLIERDDEGGFARALERVLLNEELGQRFCPTRSPARPVRVPLDRFVRRIASLYRRLLQERTEPRGPLSSAVGKRQ